MGWLIGPGIMSSGEASWVADGGAIEGFRLHDYNRPMTLLERLRIETRPAHDSIEQAMDLESRMSSVRGYEAVLQRFYGFHVLWEPTAASVLAEPAFFDPRRRTHLLIRDLHALGRGADAVAVLPVCDAMAEMTSPPEVLGAMYVMEGSTLGGTIISRHVEERLGLGPESGCAYFRSYGPAVGQMWRDFRARLSAVPAKDADAVVASAKQTFQVMQDWIGA